MSVAQVAAAVGVQAALYTGHVMHQRLRPRRHRLRYRVFSLLLDIDALPALARGLRWLSLGRFNLFSIDWRDHGAGDPAGPRAHVDGLLRRAGLPTGGAIRLLAMPRILGHAFNPLAVYFCDAPDGRLQALLYEVNNTFGQRHSYLIPVAPGVGPDDLIAQRCDKQMYVSPFLGMDMHYRFHVRPPGEALTLSVQACDDAGVVLGAHFGAVRRPVTDATLLSAFATHPLLTLKVVAGIHWEALRLWLRGVPLQPRPPAPAHAVTLVPHPSSPTRNPAP